MRRAEMLMISWEVIGGCGDSVPFKRIQAWVWKVLLHGWTQPHRRNSCYCYIHCIAQLGCWYILADSTIDALNFDAKTYEQTNWGNRFLSQLLWEKLHIHVYIDARGGTGYLQDKIQSVMRSLYNVAQHLRHASSSVHTLQEDLRKITDTKKNTASRMTMKRKCGEQGKVAFEIMMAL